MGFLKRDDEECGETAEERVRKVKASRAWRKRFLGSQRLSLRKFHARRRPIGNMQVVNQYKETLSEILRASSRDQIVNMDETTWKLLNH
jgi:hypothetical protein